MKTRRIPFFWNIYLNIWFSFKLYILILATQAQEKNCDTYIDLSQSILVKFGMQLKLVSVVNLTLLSLCPVTN